jgi:hypothetical protein
MGHELGAFFGLQTLDHILDLLAVVLVGNQHGVLGFDHDQVLQANGGHQSVMGLYQAVIGIDRYHIAFKTILVGVMRPHIPDRGRPAAVRSITE